MALKNFTELSSYIKESIQEKNVVFDTNVLVDLFYPGNINNRTSNEITKLQDIYQDCLENNKNIVIIVPIISEFYNLAVNVALKNYKKSNNINSFLNKKMYRNTQSFKNANMGIISIIDNFSTQFNIKNFNFDYLKIEDKNKKLENLDFTDLIISDFCEKENACLVTLDKDFKNVFLNDLKFSIISL
ncbi:MAG: PIN domain-containing protein [Fusobacterium gastrosuis]|uniref:PIN domain-containing protein n=1 Tax=Fusobacterium gastrosuis TaxID=1755100 RepID=UPI002A985B88|nr:PIN domain-containing protein [Fusobacterium gastrosuis]